MKTQDSVDMQTLPPEPRRTRKAARFATLGALLVVALIVGASAVVFAQLSQQHKNATQPPSGNWVSVLKGYTLSSLTAAHNSPAVLYACATHTQTSSSSSSRNISYTILHSTDFGTHWQDIGSKITLGQSCQLAINPTDSNDIFATGIPTSASGQATTTLLHSTDGGQTWTTLQPKLNVSNSSTPTQWSIEQLHFTGNALFGIQGILPTPTPPVHTGILPRYFAQRSRLFTSADGGQTWTIVDQQIAAKNVSVTSYVVDPADNKTIYELVGTPWFPVQPATAESNDVVPGFVTNEDLYKTTDGGATWQLLQAKLPFGTQIKMAESNAQELYLGGAITPLPYLPRTSAPDYGNTTQNNFRLQLSRDGGATWQTVPDMPQTFAMQGWFVASNGQVFVSGGSVTSVGQGGQPTAITGTVSASTPGVTPKMTPQTGVAPSIMEPTSSQLTTPPSVGTVSITLVLQRYDPSSNAWSAITKPPAYGALIAVTAGDANGTVLWFLSTSNQQAALYRYIA